MNSMVLCYRRVPLPEAWGKGTGSQTSLPSNPHPKYLDNPKILVESVEIWANFSKKVWRFGQNILSPFKSTWSHMLMPHTYTISILCFSSYDIFILTDKTITNSTLFLKHNNNNSSMTFLPNSTRQGYGKYLDDWGILCRGYVKDHTSLA